MREFIVRKRLEGIAQATRHIIETYEAAGQPPREVFAVGGGLMMWALLHFTRLMGVMKRAANRPVGHVDSAVMLNAKLQSGRPLLHVIAQTRALGERLSAEGAQPEIYRWRDESGSSVSCEFEGGKLARWQLVRPAQD